MTKKQQTELIAVLCKCADELESEIKFRFREVLHKNLKAWSAKEYTSAMKPVLRARKLLAEIEGK